MNQKFIYLCIHTVVSISDATDLGFWRTVPNSMKEDCINYFIFFLREPTEISTGSKMNVKQNNDC